MRFPWISRKRHESELEKVHAAAKKEMQEIADAGGRVASLLRTSLDVAKTESEKQAKHAESLRGVVTTLRAEAIADRQKIAKLTEELDMLKLGMMNRPQPRVQPQLGNFLKSRAALEAGSLHDDHIHETTIEELTKEREHAQR